MCHLSAGITDLTNITVCFFGLGLVELSKLRTRVDGASLLNLCRSTCII